MITIFETARELQDFCDQRGWRSCFNWRNGGAALGSGARDARRSGPTGSHSAPQPEAVSGGGRVANPPQDAILRYNKIVAARE